MYSYGAGGVPPPVDRPLLTYLNKRFAAEGYRIPDLLKTIASSNSFSQVTRVQPSTAPLPEDEAPKKSQQVTLNQP
jgi:hypothetical protein